MEVLKFIYENSEIEFLSSGSENVMVNATQIAKVFDKRLDHFLRSDHAKAFISELELTPFGGRSGRTFTATGFSVQNTARNFLSSFNYQSFTN